MLITQPSIMILHGGFFELLKNGIIWFLSFFPKLFATSILTWAELGVVHQLYLHFGLHPASLAVAGLASLLYVLSLYTYFMVILVGPGLPMDFDVLRADGRTGSLAPAAYEPADDEEDNSAKARLLSPATLRVPPQEYLVSHKLREGVPTYRWCSVCEVWKPDRCHHCSSCRRCYLRMDHHCPWFATCIGFRNHKLFIQVMVYITLFAGLVCASSLYMLYQFFANEQYEKHLYLLLNLVFLFVISLAFFVATGAFVSFLIYMVCINITTIEFQDRRWNYSDNYSSQYQYGPDGKKKEIGNFYSLGVARNWTSIMGRKWYQWLLPVVVADKRLDSLNNGLNYEVDEAKFLEYCANLTLQDQLNSQLKQYRDRIRGVPTPAENNAEE